MILKKMKRLDVLFIEFESLLIEMTKKFVNYCKIQNFKLLLLKYTQKKTNT